MGKYKNLISNTVIFALGTFGSKVISYLLIPLTTHYLTPAESGILAVITTTCNLILPLCYASISESIIRFGLDSEIRKRDVFTTGVMTLGIGFAVFLCCMPLLLRSGGLSGYVHLVYLYVLASASRTVVTHFVRACGYVKLFALDGMLTTLMTMLLNILFVAALGWGITGVLLATIVSDGFSALWQFLLLRLRRFVRFRGHSKRVARQMLLYSLPLVPTAVFWSVTNLSDRFFIRYMIGNDAVGLYDTANRVLPQLLVLVSGLFIQAWQISAFTEYKGREGRRFYSTVFKSYYTFIFLAASGMILLARPIILLLAKEYFDGWVYIPFLVLAVAFSCLVTFLGTIYNAAKKNVMATVTTALGAGLNILLNFKLIPAYGPQGAAVATFLSYLAVFLIRCADTRKYIRIDMQPLRIALNLALLLLQAWVTLSDFKLRILWQALILLLTVLCNLKYILFLLRRGMGMLYARRKRRVRG
jgi:O-antigen/teichoic acid export membrane protein